MNHTWINIIFDWCVNFLMNVASAIGTTYEALNVWIFVIIIPVILVVAGYFGGYFHFITDRLIKKINEYIGSFQFEPDKHISNAIEIGWRLKKEYWGNGYATEVACALVNKGIQLNKKIVARAMIENLASIRVMQKVGLKFAEEFWGDYKPHSGSPDVRYELSPKNLPISGHF